jgi:alpha-L-fucosidase
MRDDGATAYLHVFEWPENGQLEVPGFGSMPDSVTLMDGGESLAYAAFPPSEGKGIVIELPDNAPDPHVSVIRLEVPGPPDFSKVRQRQAPDGSLSLEPNRAYFHSNSKNAIQVKMRGGREQIANWFQDKSWIYWDFRITQPGTFNLSTEVATEDDVRFTYQLKDGENQIAGELPEDGHKIFVSDEFASLEGYDKVEASVPSTGSETDFTAVDLGQLEITQPGVYVLEIRPVQEAWGPVRMSGIKLEPVQ